MQTLQERRPTPVVPAPRSPEQPLARAQVPLKLAPGLAENPTLLRAHLDELLSAGVQRLDVDVSALQVLPAAALHILLETDNILRCRGGRLRLLNPTRRSIRVLASSKTLHLAC